MSNTFLSPEEIGELTDIKTGRAGKTREERQIAQLRVMKIPFYVSAIGRPRVARAVIEGAGSGHQVERDEPWVSSLA